MGDLPAQHFLSPLALGMSSDSLTMVPKSKVLGGPVDLSKHSNGTLQTLAYVTSSFYKKQKDQQSPGRGQFGTISACRHCQNRRAARGKRLTLKYSRFIEPLPALLEPDLQLRARHRVQDMAFFQPTAPRRAVAASPALTRAANTA